MGLNKRSRHYSIGGVVSDLIDKLGHSIQWSVDAHIDLYIRNAYFGGRVEVFGNLKEGEKCAHYDFPGMYNICMSDDLPSRGYKLERPLDINKAGFYRIRFTSNLKRPVLPVREDRLYFPNGEYIGTY